MKCDLYNKFYEGLEKKYNISKEEFKEYNFKQCGIFKPPYQLQNKTKLLPYYSEYFNNTYSIFFNTKEKENLRDRFIYKNKCVCGMEIKTNCFIYSREKDKLLRIGICCNKHFNQNGNKQYCVYCDTEHNNRKDNICNQCRELYKRCSKCGDYKRDYYNECSKCKFNKLYTNCYRCNIKYNKPKTFKYCYNCNLIK